MPTKKTNVKPHAHLGLEALAQAVGVVFYIAVVAVIMINGEQIFGRAPKFIGTIAFLMLFVISAAMMAVLIFGRAVMKCFDGEKKEAIQLVGATIMWLGVFIIFAIFSLVSLG